jgi:hypothetical protein
MRDVLARTIATALLLLGLTATAAVAAPNLTWTSSDPFDPGNTPTGVSCSSESSCLAVDGRGAVLSTSDPGAVAPNWSTAAVDSGSHLQAVSCVPGGSCVAVGAGGTVLAQAPGGTWRERTVDSGKGLTGVSCPVSSLCVAVDEEGDLVTSAEPLAGAWTPAEADPGQKLLGVACPSASLCVAVDEAGQELSSTEPAAGAHAWHARTIDFGSLTGVSCASAGLCVAVDAAGNALVSTDAGAGASTWALTPVDVEPLTGVSCAPTGLCVAVDGRGEALGSDDTSSLAPAWSGASVLSGSVAGVSCLPGGLCLAVGAGDSSTSGRPPGPIVATLPAGEVTPGSAVLRGSFDPRDAQPSSCRFEYGTTVAYGSSVSCSALPAAVGGTQEVQAPLGGLSPNTTYHYRLSAATPSHAATGADQSFATPISSLIAIVQPHPSISGTPAPGQTLTCHTGAEAGAVATFAYQWLRDLVPLVGATHSTYPVKGQDSGHHLQCQVTATDGGGSATARSGFATVPVAGAPVSGGETTVGAAGVSGKHVQVPLRCSPHAGSGCQIALSLTAAVKRRTVTLAYQRLTLGAGQSRTVSLPLARSARGLLAGHRQLPSTLTVSGTVIGVIKAVLAREALVLGASGKKSSAALRGREAGLPLVTDAAASGARARARAAVALAQTPYMGWDTYFALGGRYSESSVLEEASKLITLGLRGRGYRLIWLDVGWWHGLREADGKIEVSSAQWPHGLAWLTSTLHAAGFQVGLYTDAGPNGCGGAGQGSYGHYQQDVDTFAAWGFDAVKVDYCGGFEYGLEPRAAYSSFKAAIDADSPRRQMLLSICNFWQPEQAAEGQPTLSGSAFSSYSFGPTVGNSWRTDTDVGTPGNVPFYDVLRNVDADAAAPQAAGPGHWNDPDYLGPDQGMNAAQFRSQFSMWSMLAAPLMVSDDLRKIGRASLQAVQNSEVIAVDQDPAGVQGQLLSASGDGEVWVKPLAGGARAVALLNRGSGAIRISTSASEVGLGSAGAYRVRNLWSHTTSSTHGSISYRVPSFSTVMLRVSEG